MNIKILTAIILAAVILLTSYPAIAQQSVAAKNKYKIAKNMAMSGRLKDAEKELEDALKLDGHYGDALYLMGLIQIENKNYEKAVECFKKVISEQPKFYTARLYLANAYMAMNDVQKATEQVDYYITNMPSDASGHYAKGVLCYMAGDLNGAVKAWDKAISLQKEHAYAHYNRGVALFRLDKHDEGINSVKKALELKTTNAVYRFTLAHMQYLHGRTSDAMKEFKYLEEAAPSAHTGLTAAGFRLLTEEKYDEAAAKADEALKIEGSFSPAMELKSMALEKKEDFDGAIKMCEQILKNDKNDKNASERIKLLKELKEKKAAEAVKSEDGSSGNSSETETTGSEESEKNAEDASGATKSENEEEEE